VGEDPSTIREEIEQTRTQMGDTVEAIGYKTDVKSRAKESVQDRIGGVRERITGVKDATPSTGDVKQGARKAVTLAEANPIGLAVASFAGGFLVGMLLPTTDVENEKLGPMSTQLKEQARETASEAVERGKGVAQDVASTAGEAAKEHGQQQAQELKDSAQQSVERVRS
jgi:hypothetical protein